MATKNPPVTGTSVFIDPNKFDSLSGESFAGLNILKLKAGQAAGPFILKQILPKQKLGNDKKKKPVDVYVATDPNKVEIRMPVAVSFVKKAADASLAVGDEFYVRRGDDYTAKNYGRKGCASYELKITTRKK